MLNDIKYEQGLNILEQIKYNIAYDKAPIFNIVQACLASRLLQDEYAAELSEETIAALQCIIDK